MSTRQKKENSNSTARRYTFEGGDNTHSYILRGSTNNNKNYTNTMDNNNTRGGGSSSIAAGSQGVLTNDDSDGYVFANSSIAGSSVQRGLSQSNTMNTVTTMQQNQLHHRHKNSYCGCCSNFDLQGEVLEYDYALEAAQQQQSQPFNGNNNSNQQQSNPPTQPLPRIRERGEMYIDSYNDEAWSWTFGTNEQNGVWCNSSDQAGTIMSAMVWVLMLYSAFTVTALTITEGIPVITGMIYAFLVFMSLAAHAKTSFTDPGSVPVQAIPSERQRMLRDSHSMCGQCQTFKPPGSHHCRICNRCISRMDHHCPWMNNCVGAGNLKHFCLFLMYTWLCAAYSLSVFGWNYFFCADEECTFHPVVVHLVRLMTLLAIGAFLFTSSMLMNVCYGIMTGIGTIDRLKKKATNTMSQSDEEPIQLIDVFGVGGFWTWLLPTDPIFEEHDRVMGYTMPARLDRERQFCELVAQHGPSIQKTGSMDFPGKCVNDLLPV